ncbi:hypothetical protein V7S43_008171 [Phytophthora oleae]|uniref:DUF2428 domain-containing protein n=2 Tax=Phytophthora oleae TaxID=2107226 RepID=A0ABD3FHZ9_9STRA
MARPRDRDSAGRLLRVLEDCKLFHMEAAIASLGRVKNGIRSEALIKPSDGDAGELKRTADGRVLSLSDHKRIARLQAALATVATAYDVQSGQEGTGEIDLKRNLVCTVAGSAMMLSMRDCTASRTNCCIWGPQAEKVHVLLDWMMSHECGSSTEKSIDYVRQLLLEWIHPTAEKQNQLAACLTIFELLQRRRRMLKNTPLACERERLCLFGDRAGVCMDALRRVAERGTVLVAASHRAKPSKLTLIALETLALLCGDVGVQYMTSSEAAKRNLVEDGLMREAVESMRFFLVSLRRWHLHSRRRQFLGYALQHLQAYVVASDSLLSSVDGDKGDTRDLDVSVRVALDVLCWQWEATASMFCTRSDASSRIQKQSAEILARVVTFDTFSTKENSTLSGSIFNPEELYAKLRYVCVLMDSIGGVKGCSKAFGAFPVESKASFIFLFVKGLSTATKDGNNASVLLVLQVLRALMLAGDAFHLLSSREEEQELLSELLRVHSNAWATRGNSDCSLQAQTELELFIADFIISRGLFVTGLEQRVRDTSDLTSISLVRTFLYQLDSLPTQSPLFRYWRKQLTPAVLDLITHGNYFVRRQAVSCLPSLDAVSCITELATAGIDAPENYVLTSALGLLFVTSSRNSLEMMASWFIDAIQFGSVQVHSISNKIPKSPREWSDYSIQLATSSSETIALGDKRKELQEKMLAFCFGPVGWSKHIQATEARSEVLRILIRKIFGSPRDPALLRMLREFAACNWINHDVFQIIGKQICIRMMTVPRLSEDYLNDNSPSAAKTIEGLLFSRLAPLLVLRMLPRNVFGTNRTQTFPCGREDLNHLNSYIDCQQQLYCSSSEASSEVEVGTTSEIFLHLLTRSVVDPLEFKEVKMLATECLAKFAPVLVLPLVFGYLVAFLREAIPHDKRDSSRIVEDDNVPDSCGLVTAKLMVYYLNRVFSEDDHAYKDCSITSKVLVLLVQVLGIPSVQDFEEALLTDLQRGCIDCIAMILTRLAASNTRHDNTKEAGDATSLMNLLMTWIFGTKSERGNTKERDAGSIDSRVQELLEGMWSGARYDQLPLQVRVCCCNILLNAISRLESRVLAGWKTQGVITRIALASEKCSKQDVVAGGLQIIFLFLCKASELISIEDCGDLQLVRACFEATTAHLEATRSESVAMNGLKVIGAIIGNIPGFIRTLPPTELQQLIDRYDTNLN